MYLDKDFLFAWLNEFHLAGGKFLETILIGNPSLEMGWS